MQITGEHIDKAFDQIETIARIHEGKDIDAQNQAINTYLEFLGMSKETSEQLADRVRSYVPKERGEQGAYGWVYMGVVIGLTAAQATESF